MFVRQNQQQFRNSNADVQIFYGSGSGTSDSQKSWIKPAGVSHVYMLLIGRGGNGNSASSGGSGAVTVWYGAAQNVPDNLIIVAASSGSTGSYVFKRFTSTSLITLLSADGGLNPPNAGAAMTANQFTASGFFQSIAGQPGDSGASTTTFLSCGSNGANSANYGYNVPSTNSGYFMMQPIIVGAGGSGSGSGGIGCGGGFSSGVGGPGMVLIASW